MAAQNQSFKNTNASKTHSVSEISVAVIDGFYGRSEAGINFKS